jgi:hypothetical protein
VTPRQRVMQPYEIEAGLSRVASADDLVSAQYDLTDSWIAAEAGIECVEPVLRFMEDHPDLDFGMPGPLVHFVERFHRTRYEAKLIESVERKPTSHTVWMLKRLLNGTHDTAERKRLVEILGRIRVATTQRLG